MNAMPTSFVSALGWALIDFLWQGALIGCVAAIALMLLRNARAQARYALSCTALALCLALPALGVWQGLHADASTNDVPAARFVQLAGAPRLDVRPEAIAASSTPLVQRLPWIVALWSLGAALLATRMAFGMMWVARVGRAHGMPHPRWQRRIDRLAEKLGVECRVHLRVVTGLATPVAAGCWKPMVLVPAALIAQMPLDLVEALLAHELAHIRRHDYLVNLIQSAIEALLFYHPVVWWLSRRIRNEREQIADDLAARAIGEPRRLALALHELDLFQHQQRMREADDGFAIDSLLPAANGGHLMSRIQRLVRPNPHALSWNLALPIIGLSAICMAVYAHGTPDTTTVQQASTATASPIVSSTTITPAVASPSPAMLALLPVPHPHPARIVVAGKGTTVLARATNPDDDTYAIVRDGQDGIRMSGDSDNMPAIEKTRKQVHGDFIWVRRNHKVYVVQDPAVIAGVVEVMKPEAALDAQMEMLDKKMEGPNQHMEELNRRMEALNSGQHPYTESMDKLGKQIEVIARQEAELGVKQAELGLHMGDAKDSQRGELDRQMQALKMQMEPLELQMKKLDAEMEDQSRQIETAQKPIEDLGRQMEEAGKPMEELGKQMETLGKQEEELSREIDRKVEALIDEAVRTGKATPGDGIRDE
ncbi:MAG TPA: M56 family metallopeptidase [Xanthomonadaceae bacterium]|nr:M56 family metallopeptidase [Xanthomonadaceae bacterium]